MDENENQSADQSASESTQSVDDLYASITGEPRQEVQASPAQAQEFEFVHKGKQIKLPISDPKFKQWIQQGYDYSTNISQLNKEREAFTNELSSKRALLDRYSKVDEYAKTNPQWWDYVIKQYEATLNGGQSTQTSYNPNDPIVRQISEMSQQLSALNSEREQARFKEEDARLNQEIEEVHKQYPKLDWDSVNEAGQSLRDQVLKFAYDNKYPSFESAFLVHQKANILNLERERAKEDVVKQRQKQTKLGLLGSSPTPKSEVAYAKNTKNKSWDDLGREALEELGLG